MDNEKNPFSVNFMDDYYDDLMEKKMNDQDPYSLDTRFSFDSLVGNRFQDFERDQANQFIDAYYMEEYEEMEKEFYANLMKPKNEPKPKHDYRQFKHIRDFKKAAEE